MREYISLSVSPVDHRYEYPGVPPETLSIIEPSDPPTVVGLFMVADAWTGADGCEIVKDTTVEHPFESNMVTSCGPAWALIIGDGSVGPKSREYS